MIRVHRCVRYDEKTVVVEQKHSSHFIERIGRFLIAEEDLRIETSYPFNKVTAVFLLHNYCLFILYNCYLNTKNYIYTHNTLSVHTM